MTREYALKVLDTIPTIGDQVDALEMAISALENEDAVIDQALEIIEKVLVLRRGQSKLTGMTREEIIEGLKQIYYRVYAITDYRKTLEACFKLLENENALIDRVLEIMDSVGNRAEAGDMDAYEVYTEIRKGILTLKGGAQE